MKMKKKPERMCLVCRERNQKGNLIRIVKLSKSDIYKIDNENKLDGRGAYICCNPDCIKACVKKRLLNKSFKCQVPSDIYEDLQEKYIDENKI